MLAASGVLAAITLRALAEADAPITLVQFRTLVLVSNRGPINLATLAHDLGVQPSTTSRMVERLVQVNLLERRISPHSRRELRVEVTERGRALVERVTRRRYREIQDLVERIPADERLGLMRGLSAFAAAGIAMRAGPMVEQIWP
ncbi:MAG: MarR family transcriptional regulator [Aldersonia sp.]|nr:MarR family transcriptional regulator [Aldersonia sp.]